MTDKRGTGTFVTDTTELTTNNLDIYTPPITEHVLRSGMTVELNPINALSNSGPFEFQLSRDPDHYTYLPLTRLYGTVRVVKSADSKDLADTDAVSISNFFPQTLFKQVEIEVEGKQVNDISSSTYPIKAFLETSLTYGVEAKKTHLTLAGWEDDEIGKEDKYDDNSGWVKRKKRIVAKNYHFSMIIHADFLQMEKFLLPNTNMNIKLIRNFDNYSLISATSIGKIEFKNLRLSVHKVKIADDFNNAILSNLAKETALYPITQAKIKTVLIQNGTSTTTIQNVLSGTLPQSVVIGFLDSKSFNGDVTHNPFHFQHFNLNLLNLKINGKPFHPRPLQPDYDDGDFKREYRLFLDNTGIHHGNMTIDISEEKFASSCNLYPFDFTPDLCNSYHHHSTKTGHIDIDLGFKKALTTSIYMIVYSAHPQTITIDHNRNTTLIE